MWTDPFTFCMTMIMALYFIVPLYIPYGRKLWRGIYFGGLAVLRAIQQYFHLSNFLQYDVIVTYTLLRDVINMWSTVIQNVRTKASNFERMEQK